MRLPTYLSEWINLAGRWFHVFAAIMWVGTTYYFTWLDARFTEEERAGTKDEGADVWMVHSGGFYQVSKRKKPSLSKLHWFRWEAALTWLSGMVLLTFVYYLGGGMVDSDVWDTSQLTASLVGVGTLVGAWIIYDLLVQSPLGRNEKAFAVAAFALVVGLIYLLTHTLSGRAAYIHLGAAFGTIMVANVWMRILPAQRRMIAATKAGQTPDAADAARAKLRSKHNTFMAVPVVFTMISNHYATEATTGGYNWLVLVVMVLVGWVAAKFIRRA
ncbi:MAG TPA: urate hydroxylase PuuD [Pyrinomonadaceae bacterium]|nr:urate hydroxylase PuuD [Pyrinomonadaceae bacterium]